jgi:hypothetical protein
LRQAAGAHAAGKVARHEGWAGRRDVAHGAQGLAVAAGGGAGRARHGGQHGAAAQPFGGVILVVHGHVHQHRGLRRKGSQHRREPGGQTVGIHGYGQVHARDALRRQGWQRASQILLQQAHAIHVLAQAPPRFSGAARLFAHHQGAAHTLFQQPDALRHRRRRDVQRERRAFKTAFANDGRQCSKGRIVQHGISPSKAN